MDGKADYVLAPRDNQGTLRDDITVFVRERKGRDFGDATVGRNETIDAGHGRIETRTTTVIHDVDWLRKRHAWPGLAGVVAVDSRRESNDETGRETRLHITSSKSSAEFPAAAVRGHWSIGNGLHWVMDMVFRDDECRLRIDHAPANVTILRHMACNLPRRAPGKIPLRARRKAVAWNDDSLATLLGG